LITNLTHEPEDDIEEPEDDIPKSDEDFDAWLDNFITYAKEHLDELPISKEELANLEAQRDEWKIACANSLEAEALAKDAQRELSKAARNLKVAQRESMDGGALPLIKGVPPNLQLRKLMRPHAATSLREMMSPEEDQTGEDES